MSKSHSLSKLQKITNPQKFSFHSLNRSSSKMMYSFNRSLRFLNKYEKGVPYYDKPSQLSHRKSGIGYGQKTTFEDRRGFPPPNRYNISREFEGRKRGISFGLSRERVHSNSIFHKTINPGPGSYNARPLKRDPSYSMRRQVHDNSQDQKIKVPGPGQYNVQSLINNTGRTGNSKYGNVKTIIIRKAMQRVKTQETPGPSSYFPRVLNERSKKPIAMSQAFKFRNSRREGIYTSNRNPGPGEQYLSSQLSEHFSQFIH